MTENKTEQEYLEMANHAKQLVEDKENEIKILTKKNKYLKRAIRKMSNLILNLQENIKKMEFLVDFHKGNLRNILGCFYGQLDDIVSTTSFDLSETDLIPRFSEDDSSDDDEEEEDIHLTLHTILNLLGEPVGISQFSQNQ
jgi:hypothetical protein